MARAQYSTFRKMGFDMQRCNSGEIFGATSAMLGQNLPPLPPGWNRVKISENLGATGVTLVSPVVKSLICNPKE